MSKELKPASNSILQIKYTPKTRTILSDKHKILTLYGSTGNGKSMLMMTKGLSRIYKSPREHKTYVLAGRDITTLEKRFVESNHSVLNWYPFAGRWTYRKQNVSGGSQIVLHTETGDKQLFLTPFNNIAAYGRILGSTIDGFLIDEGVESDENFLRECVSRTIRQQHTWLIQTSNGGNPSHYFYEGIVDKSMTIDDFEWEEFVTSNQVVLSGNPKGLPVEKSVPIEELKWQADDRDNFKMFYHLSLEDNPTYTKEQLEAYYNEYPPGSFMWFSRIMGIRGFTESSPFSAYLGESVFVSVEKTRDIVDQMVFSVDSGGHVFSNKYMPDSPYRDGDQGTNKGGHTVMVTVGFNRNMDKAVIIDTFFPNRMIQVDSVERITERVYRLAGTFRNATRPYMFSDPADSTMLATLMGRVKNVSQVRRAVNRDNKIKLDEPTTISLIQQYFATGDLKIMDSEENRKWLIPALISQQQDTNGYLIDNESWESDVADALKMAFSSLYRLLVRNRMTE